MDKKPSVAFIAALQIKMKTYRIFSPIVALAFTGHAHAEEKVAIIKADDIHGKTEKWNRFLRYPKKRELRYRHQ